MRMLLISLALSLLIPATASANARAPIATDGDISAAMASTAVMANLELKKEQLTIDFDRLPEEGWNATASIKAHYTFENSSAEEITTTLLFMATDIKSAKVSLNQASLSAPITTEMSAAQLRELDIKDASVRAKEHQFTHNRRKGQIAKFEATFKPGANELIFSYRQNVVLYERGAQYGPADLTRSTTGINYFLYPAKSWTLAADFQLNVSMNVPDLVDEGWFFDDESAPQMTSNLKFTEAYSEEKSTTTYVGSFSNFAVDVLAVRIKWNER